MGKKKIDRSTLRLVRVFGARDEGSGRHVVVNKQNLATVNVSDAALEQHIKAGNIVSTAPTTEAGSAGKE